MIIFWHRAGPLVVYEGGTLLIKDHKPGVAARWGMSRVTLLLVGWRCIIAAISAR